MAFETRKPRTTSAPRTEGATNAKATLGFINIGLPNSQGKERRIDAIRLLAGNALHQQLFDALALQRPGDEKLTAEQGEAAKLERLAKLTENLKISFNPSATDADNELDLFG